MKNYIKKLRDKHFNLSEESKFRFDILNYKTDGMIFISSVLLVPLFLALFIFFISFNDKNSLDGWPTTVFSVFYLLSVATGLIFHILRNGRQSFKTGYLWIYMFILGPQVVALPIIFIIPLLAIFSQEQGIVNWYSSILITIFTELIILILAAVYNKKFFKRLKETFKTKWKELIVVTLIGTILLFLISTFLFSNLIETKLFGLPESQNEINLKKMLNGENGNGVKISAIILLFILTVVLAPICEELCMRDSFNLNASNRWLGFVGSAMFFGFIHYGPSFDFEHFLSYTSAGFILSGIFLFTKGNATYTWTLHLTNNLIAFILVLSV
ncbi:CPBP family intramembrane glutamic endopeptidase [Spiroplasma diminutum]|uniref:CAAX amino terminal membrane bound protease n=1 Tax=Spiroplasma diminutum CUAS-1 TaxID=1276221 RepID=S5LZ32_9MOLU|nr:CPBP family intramembrane glutamic endopeptidase [Spiroplasma diminutum]AGR41816.1 CAAX amino terminal membrane bound protease [Spiroplasma diminutum CUAS-1]